MSNVDWSVVEKYELTTDFGYTIPGTVGDRSGITVASGVDLGQHSVHEIEGWQLPVALMDKLRPYIGPDKRGNAARNMLYGLPPGEAFRPDRPLKSQIVAPVTTRVHGADSSALVSRSNGGGLSLTADEVRTLDAAARRVMLRRIEARFDKSAGSGKHFKSIPASCQTAIVLFCYQFGANVAGKADRRGRYWKAVTASDWAAAIDCLLGEFFGAADKPFEKRRLEEIFLLRRGMGTQPWGPLLKQRFDRWSAAGNVA